MFGEIVLPDRANDYFLEILLLLTFISWGVPVIQLIFKY